MSETWQSVFTSHLFFFLLPLASNPQKKNCKNSNQKIIFPRDEMCNRWLCLQHLYPNQSLWHFPKRKLFGLLSSLVWYSVLISLCVYLLNIQLRHHRIAHNLSSLVYGCCLLPKIPNPRQSSPILAALASLKRRHCIWSLLLKVYTKKSL